MAKVELLLATFNGARWLPELLASIQGQTHDDWQILARDDGSTDGTVALLAAFMAAFPGRMRLLDAANPRPGAPSNFSLLLQASTAPYVMLCDQDDVWLPHKITATLRRMQEVEAAAALPPPVTIFSDLQVVDEHLELLSPSLWDLEGLNRGQTNLGRLLVQNVVTGCTLMANRALVVKAGAIPPEAIMHDWWLALVAQALGHLEPLDEALILYRQHQANTSGAKAYSFGQAVRFVREGKLRRYLLAAAGQARAFHQRFGPELGDRDQMVTELAGIGEGSWLSQRACLLRHRLFLHGAMRNGCWLLLS